METFSVNTLVKLLIAAFVGLFFLPFANSPVVQADEPPDTFPKRIIYIRRDPVFNPQRIPPPPPRDPNVISAQAISFSINFDDGAGCGSGSFSAWPSAAKVAFNYAANQWSALVDGTVPIDIHACWQSDLPFGVLGGASHDWKHSSQFTGEPIIDSWYPTALADQLQGTNTNAGNYDIDATFASSGINWYFGTDGNPASNQTDFVSVVMHEIGHGLGFDGLMNYGASCGGANYGCWSGSGYPGVFDRFVETGSGQKLLTFANPSVALGNELIGDNLYFNGPNANAAWSGNRPKIYAPATWMPGSSYAHLDYDTFNATAHGLMVWALSDGAARHHPGAVTLGMFQDMGWVVNGGTASYKVYLPLLIKSAASGPTPGYWSSTGIEFYVTTDSAYVDNFAIIVDVTGCGSYKITHFPLESISNNKFSFSSDGFYASGSFSTNTTANGTTGLNSFYISGCGSVSGGPWTFNSTWQSSSQPTAVPATVGERAEVVVPVPKTNNSFTAVPVK